MAGSKRKSYADHDTGSYQIDDGDSDYEEATPKRKRARTEDKQQQHLGSLGGPSGRGGFRFQDAVAAHYMALMLSGVTSLGSDAFLGRVQSVGVETTQPVDDVNVEGAHGRIFIQAKAKLSFSKGDFPDAVRQCVLQVRVRVRCDISAICSS